MAAIPTDDAKSRRPTDARFHDRDIGEYGLQGYADPSQNSDHIALLLYTGNARLLFVSSYEPKDGVDKKEKEEAIRGMTDNIERVKKRAEEEVRGAIDTLICADRKGCYSF